MIFGQALIWTGIAIGNLEYLCYFIWAASADITEGNLQKAAWVFVLTQPLWHLFVFVLYMGQHQDIREVGDRCKKMAVGFPFMLGQQLKLLSGLDRVHTLFLTKCDIQEARFQLVSMENLFRMQTVLELFGLSLPLMAVITMNANARGAWDPFSKFCVFLAVLMFIKNLSFVTVFAIRKLVDGAEDPPMRPQTSRHKMNRVELEAFSHIQSYLIDPHDDGVDGDGNTTVHQLMRYEADWATFEAQLSFFPHHLFMLNKFG